MGSVLSSQKRHEFHSPGLCFIIRYIKKRFSHRHIARINGEKSECIFHLQLPWQYQQKGYDTPFQQCFIIHISQAHTHSLTHAHEQKLYLQK